MALWAISSLSLGVVACQSGTSARGEEATAIAAAKPLKPKIASSSTAPSNEPFQVAARAIRLLPLEGTRWLSIDAAGVTLWNDRVPTRTASFRCFPNCILSSDKQRLHGNRQTLNVARWGIEKNTELHPDGLRPFAQMDYWHPSPDGKQALGVAVVRRTDLRRDGDGVESRFVVSTDDRSTVELETKGNTFSAWSQNHLAITHETKEVREVQLRDRSTLGVVARFNLGREYINGLVFSANGARVFAKTNKNHAAAWNVEGALVAEWRTESQIWSFDVNAAGDAVALATGDRLASSGTIEIWSVETPAKKLRTIAVPQRPELVVWHEEGIWVGGVDTGELHDDRVFRYSAP